MSASVKMCRKVSNYNFGMKEGLHKDATGHLFLHVHRRSQLDLRILNEIDKVLGIPENRRKLTNAVEINLDDGTSVRITDITDKVELGMVLETVRDVVDRNQDFVQYPGDEGVFIEFSEQANGKSKAVVKHAHRGQKIPGVVHYMDVAELTDLGNEIILVKNE